MSVTKAKALLRLKSIGRVLIEGPRSLFPPIDIDDFGWLEPQLRILKGPAPNQFCLSASVFCDDTVNRDTDFLPPVIRLARWDRASDLESVPDWPNVSVRYGHVRDWESVHRMAKELQASTAVFHFESCGLAAEREVPDVYEEGAEAFNIMMDNGMQRIEISTWAIQSDSLSNQIPRAYANLAEQSIEFDSVGWRERYNYDPTHNDNPTRWDRVLRADAV